MKYFLLFILFPFLNYPQSEYLDSSSVFGLSVGMNYSANNLSSVLGGTAAISLLGIIDVGIQTGSIEIENSRGAESSSNMFYLAFNSKRNDKSCLKFALGYYSGSVSQLYGNNISITGLIVGLDFFLKVYEDKNVAIIPDLGLTYGFMSMKKPNTYYLSKSTFDDSRSLSLGINFKTKISKAFSLVFGPSFAKDLLNSENSVMIGFGAGIIISAHKQELTEIH